MSIISARDVYISQGKTQVIHGVSLEIADGEFIGLIGPNGAGKSTLLRAMVGLMAFSGQIRLDGEPLSAMTAGKRARHVAYVPQEHEIAWPLAVETLVGLGRKPHRAGFSPFTTHDRQVVQAAMKRMDVDRFSKRSAVALSGGEKARVLIARALAQETPVLLADEPTAGLDPAYQIALMKVFRALAVEGRAVVASLHDLGLAARWCTRLILLHDGRIIADGKPLDVLTPENLRTIYGVSGFFGEAAGVPVIQPLDLADKD